MSDPFVGTPAKALPRDGGLPRSVWAFYPSLVNLHGTLAGGQGVLLGTCVSAKSGNLCQMTNTIVLRSIGGQTRQHAFGKQRLASRPHFGAA